MQIRDHVGHADKPAIILHPAGTVITFDELEARANRLAHYFRQHGLREGDAVAILMENNEHMHAVMWAARRSGLYYVPINTHLTAAEAAYIIDNSGAQGHRRLGGAAQDVCENLGRASARRPARHAADRRRRPGRLAALPGMRCRPTRYPHRRRDRRRPAAVLVGHDRPAEGHQARTAARAARRGARHDVGAGRASGCTPTPSISSPAPLYHTAPSVWSMQVQAGGITTVVLEKFDAEGALDAIQRHRRHPRPVRPGDVHPDAETP